MLVITPPQIKNFQEPHWQVNHKTTHNDKDLVVTMFKRLTDPSIPILNKLRRLRSNRLQLMISDKNDPLVGPTVYERYDILLLTSEKQVTPRSYKI